ncbi:MAG: RNA 2',3'-cyclic phosphodiesterase [Candidatus Aminicenantes bacterium]|nr:MAG: RNA 2',3'-cyclic phosphodiesterase [Candidatus Aminicenantes bacterium]
MRVFIGIKLDERVHDEIEKFLKSFKKISSPVRWVKPENVHITLKFIGEVSEEKYSHIERRLSEAEFSTGPFDLRLAGCGKFGRGNTLNIFWIGIVPSDPLTQIFKKIETTLAKAGIEKEKRQFKPHITVGRNKKNFNFKSFFQLIEENSDRLISEFTVSHFQVFKSQLRPEGPIYTVLKEISLG